jgi:hypothetical protein
MDIKTFKECNVVYAKNQPEYLNLPSHKSEKGIITTCWTLSWKEKFKILTSGYLWLQVMTFNNPLQPLKMSTIKPKMEEKIDD